MMKRFIAAVFFAVILFLNINTGNAQVAVVQPERISPTGHVFHNIMGVPYWSENRRDPSNPSLEEGDLFVFGIRVDPKEKIAICLYYFSAKTQQETGEPQVAPDTPFTPVPVSSTDVRRRYRSNANHGLIAGANYVNTSDSIEEKGISLFVPYSAIGLKNGKYEFRYRVVVWINDKITDDFKIEKRFVADFKSAYYRRVDVTCDPGEETVPMVVPESFTFEEKINQLK